MALRTRVTLMARQRGLTAAEVARRLRLYPSNVSAMDAGRRAVSLRLLGRIAAVLDCHPGELLEIDRPSAGALFSQRGLNEALGRRERRLIDGTECGWVHAALLAWQRHYAHRRVSARP